MPRRQAGAGITVKVCGKDVFLPEDAISAGSTALRLATGKGVSLADYAYSLGEFFSAWHAGGGASSWAKRLPKRKPAPK